MIKSMTGYGKGEAFLENGKLTIEIKTLNGRNADVNIKSYLLPKDKEVYIRQRLAERLQRGTIDLFINFEENVADGARKINAPLVKKYFEQIENIREEIKSEREGYVGNGIALQKFQQMQDNIILSTILRFSDIFDNSKPDIITDENWPLVKQAFEDAILNLDEFRSKEGEALRKDITSGVKTIMELENEVEKLEGERIETVKTNLNEAIEKLQQKPDQSRFEQEMIFYLEKYDINEEKVRLRQHCHYFLDTVENEDRPGKKLGFILQEMGREINTTGSKANHAGIQKLVIKMKDELEKIREQSLNIL